MTQHREQRVQAAHDAGNHAVLLSMLRELHGISHSLDQRDEIADFNPAAIGVSNESRALREQRDWPIPGGRRWLLGQRQGYGQQMSPSAAAVDLLPANAARLGGLLSFDNAATAPLIAYLADAKVVNAGTQVPRILVAPGGRWDFKLGDLVWCGSLSVSCANPGFLCLVAEI